MEEEIDELIRAYLLKIEVNSAEILNYRAYIVELKRLKETANGGN